MRTLSTKKILLLLCTMLLVFGTDTFIAFANVDETIKHIFQFFIVIFTVILFLISLPKLKNYSNHFVALSVFILLILLTMIVNADFSNGNIIKIILLLFGAFFCLNFDFNDFKKTYVKLTIIVSIFSLITFVCTPLIQKYLMFLPKVSNGSYSVYFLILSNVPTNPNETLRNWGPFWEPGVFQAYLLIALIFVLYDDSWSKKYKYILSIALVSTFSTTGFLGLVVVWIGYLMRRNKIYPKKITKVTPKKLLIFLIVFVVFLVLMVNLNLFEMIFDKLNPNSDKFASTYSRLLSITGNIYVLLKNPLFGCGTVKMENIFNEFIFQKLNGSLSNSNGLLLNFSVFGLLFGSFYLILIIKFASKIVSDKFSSFVIFLCLIFILFSEPLINSLLFNTIIFYGIKNRDYKLKSEFVCKQDKLVT